jgi:hypothetical protein
MLLLPERLNRSPRPHHHLFGRFHLFVVEEASVDAEDDDAEDTDVPPQYSLQAIDASNRLLADNNTPRR